MTILTVTNIKDNGVGSLRAAMATAQTGDTITFASNLAGQTITLTTGEIAVTKSLKIDASAAPNLRISGNNKSRIFSIEKSSDVSIKGLTFINGRAVVEGTGIGQGGAIKVKDYSKLTVENSTFRSNVAERGGAIQVGYGGSATVLNSIFDSNDGSIAKDGFSAGAIATSGAGGSNGAGKLVIKGSKFTNNKGVVGGAVYVLLGPLTIENSTFSNNQSSKEGGAVFTDGASGNAFGDDLGGTTTISGSRFEGNKSVAGGGALYLWGHTNDEYIIKDSTLVGNSVTRGGPNNVGRGGAIQLSGGNLTLDSTTIARNTSPVQGGGLWVNNNKSTTSVNIINSTFSENTAEQDAGGGIYFLVSDTKPVQITNSTLVNNRAGRDAGAIWTSGKTRDVTLKNTLFAGNTATNTRQGNTNFQLKDGGGNFVETLAGNKGPSVTATAEYVGDLKLGPLQLIGDDLVHPLLAGSPAINTGVSGAPTTDQRGVSREGKPDAGAYEFTTVPGNLTLIGATGNDSLIGGTGNDYLNGLAGDDYLNGLAGNDSLIGATGNDYLNGGTGNDSLYGGAGKDFLLGSSGNDLITGGAGTDTMNGGAGSDKFRFPNVTHSRAGISRDIITDFITGVDDIDLSAIDSNLSVAGNQTFTFIGTGSFTGVGDGEVRYYQLGGDTIIQVDRQGNGISAEMEVQLTGLINLVAGDFIL